MAKLHVSEYNAILKADVGEASTTDGVAKADVAVAQAVKEPAIAEQAVTFTTATQSSAFNAATKIVRVAADAQCYIAFGANPTATANSKLLPSFGVEYFGVTPGDKVSVYDGTS